jgi:2-haloacid dehalogenase
MAVVVFDIGNVLLRWDPRNLYRKIFTDTTAMEWFLGNICDGRWNLAQDMGRTWSEAVNERISQFPEWETQIRAYDERWVETLDGEIHENVQLLEKLSSAGIRTFAISNFSSEKWAIAKDLYKFFEYFEGIVISGDVRLVKPDPLIFQLLLNRYDLAAEECVFIDDNEANVLAARELGMSAVHYREPMDLSKALGALGVVF